MRLPPSEILDHSSRDRTLFSVASPWSSAGSWAAAAPRPAASATVGAPRESAGGGPREQTSPPPWDAVLTEVLSQVEPQRGRGRVADCVPALREVDPRKLGLALVACDGAAATVGDADEPLSVQSVAKVFALTLALREVGDGLWERVGREPAGTRFNSIVQLVGVQDRLQRARIRGGGARAGAEGPRVR